VLFDSTFNKAKWRGKDSFPSCSGWKHEINKWLEFIQGKNQLKRYLPRLNDSKTMRDEALAEILSAYVIEVKLKYSIIGWEEITVGGKNVDFVIREGLDEIYCEVKSPGWESELKQKELLNRRKGLPKYINREFRSIVPWKAIRHAIKKSYSKFLPNYKNLVILKDDLFVSILDRPSNIIDIALYEALGIYDGEKGFFSNNNYENVGGILILNCRLTNRFEYRYKFIGNKHSKEPFSIITPKN